MRLRSLASLRPWLYPYNIEIIYIPISIIYYLVSYYGTVFLCINLLLTFTVIQPAAAKVINKQIKSKKKYIYIYVKIRIFKGLWSMDSKLNSSFLQMILLYS